MIDPKVTVIVLSYNRPNMLRQALTSISGAYEVILLDDGSDFDVVSLAQEFHFNKFSMIGSPKITLEERLTTQRIAAMINEAIRQASGDIITYLCDDDMMDPEWIEEITKFYQKYDEKYHFIRGNVTTFEDDKKTPWEKQARHFMFMADGPRQLITGNFAHLRKCCTEEGRMWPEDKMVGHDTAFFDNVDEVHDTFCIPQLPVNAVFRRIHDKMLTNHTYYNADGTVTLDKFSEGAKDLIKKNKFLE